MVMNKRFMHETSVVGFEEQVTFKLKNFKRSKMRLIIAANQDLFFNESHFVRCAINKMLRDFDERGKKKKEVTLRGVPYE